MKKGIFVFAAIFSFAIFFTACKETKKDEVKEDIKIENHEGHDHNTDATADVYQCPMDCEHGKTYDKAGSCPVCNMDLKVKSVDKKELQHADNCTCTPGECKCGDEVASAKKECTKCEPGACKCKA